jgi:hypothetical protein
MAVAEEHKPVEKRRALGRGLDSLLPSGPRILAPLVGTNAARTAIEPQVPLVPPPPAVHRPTQTTSQLQVSVPSENREGWASQGVAGAAPASAPIS